MTKDADFLHSFLLSREPRRLLLVTTGNISNRELETVFVENLLAITAALDVSDLLELSRTSLIVRGRE